MAVLVVFLPLVAAAIAGFFGRVIGDRGVQIVTCGALLASMVLAVPLFRAILAADGAQVVSASYDRSLFAGRTALLVPIVSVCTAGTVTCFLAAYKVDILFSVSLAVWSVAGIVSLAAITGCVALLGRLAQLQAGIQDEELPANPPENREKYSGPG